MKSSAICHLGSSEGIRWTGLQYKAMPWGTIMQQVMWKSDSLNDESCISACTVEATQPLYKANMSGHLSLTESLQVPPGLLRG